MVNVAAETTERGPITGELTAEQEEKTSAWMDAQFHGVPTWLLKRAYPSGDVQCERMAGDCPAEEDDADFDEERTPTEYLLDWPAMRGWAYLALEDVWTDFFIERAEEVERATSLVLWYHDEQAAVIIGVDTTDELLTSFHTLRAIYRDWLDKRIAGRKEA